MDGGAEVDDAAIGEAFEDGRAVGRAEAACDCNHREGCQNRPQKPPSLWRRWLDTVTS